MAKNKIKRKYVSRHHIIPRSRGGGNELENIVKIDGRDHQHYHAIFENKRPEEIIEHLVEHYWKGEWGYVNYAIRLHNREYL